MSKPMAAPAVAIRVLDPDTAARIAAGEVLENPASAVRELVDNAVDAGARRVCVEARAGGKAYLSVADDGAGMGRADLELCVARHATSKIRTVDDLARVTSLGFRGEALYAIAAVSRLRIVSAPRADAAGAGAHELLVEDGHLVHLRAAAGAPGTLVEVTRLFHAVPARLEFLKSDRAEAAAVKRTVLEKMLAAPHVAFELVLDGVTALSGAPGDLAARIAQLYGAAYAAALLPVSGAADGMRVGGWITAPHEAAATRRDQHFLLNGRPVASPMLSHALAHGYHNLLAGGRHPAAFLELSIDPALVNVNVHPAKREVRFRDADAVHRLVSAAVRDALAATPVFARLDGATLADDPFASAPPSSVSPPPPRPYTGGGYIAGGALGAPPLQASFGFGGGGTTRTPYGLGEERAPWTEPALAAPAVPELVGLFAGLKVAGRLFAAYWLLEGEDRALVVDQHAAHERVLYEEFAAAWDAGQIAAQPLLVPVPLSLSAGDAAVLEEHAAAVARAGFEVEPSGPGTWAAHAVPAHLAGDPRAALAELVAVLAREKPRGIDDARERLLATMACKAAWKAGDPLLERELAGILNRLAALPRPFSCPHGRPAVVEIKRSEIESWFKRG